MNTNQLLTSMIAYHTADPARIQHFLKVYGFAKLIGELEKLDTHTQQILETAAIVHDIGIKPAEEAYGTCDGPLQERLVPAEAEKMLSALGYEPWHFGAGAENQSRSLSSGVREAKMLNGNLPNNGV